MTLPKYPNVHIQLGGQDGNAFSILGRAVMAMRRGKCTQEQIDAYLTEAKSGDYNHLLVTTMDTVNCDNMYDECDDA